MSPNSNKPDQMRHIDDLIQIMNTLLSPQGCPWDREQTPQTLAPYAIEEAHELAEALERKDQPAIREELGDLLLQVVFHAALAQKEENFDFGDVVNAICTKLIRRHPHVFANVAVSSSEEVLKNWAAIKKEEKANRPQKHIDVPVTLPALQRAQKIGDKTKTLKFDWSTPKEVFTKVQEEFTELQEAFQKDDAQHTAEELGDLFFVLAQLARHLKLEAETVARAANRKFEMRFDKMLERAAQKGLDFHSLTLDEKEKLWQEIKS